MPQLSSWMVVITSGLPQAIGEGMKLKNGIHIMRLKMHFWFVRVHVCSAGFLIDFETSILLWLNSPWMQVALSPVLSLWHSLWLSLQELDIFMDRPLLLLPYYMAKESRDLSRLVGQRGGCPSQRPSLLTQILATNCGKYWWLIFSFFFLNWSIVDLKCFS